MAPPAFYCTGESVLVVWHFFETRNLRIRGIKTLARPNPNFNPGLLRRCANEVTIEAACCIEAAPEERVDEAWSSFLSIESVRNATKIAMVVIVTIIIVMMIIHTLMT